MFSPIFGCFNEKGRKREELVNSRGEIEICVGRKMMSKEQWWEHEREELLELGYGFFGKETSTGR